MKTFGVRGFTNTGIFHFPDTIPRQIIIPYIIFCNIDRIFDAMLHGKKLFFSEVGAFKDGFLNPCPVFFQNFDNPIPLSVVNNVKTYQIEHGGVPQHG
jgi:hypothetical protein